MADQKSAGAAKQKKGRAPFVPSSIQRDDVASLAASRALHAHIAAVIGISVPTLRKHFSAELATRVSADNLFTATPEGLPVQSIQVKAPKLRTPRADGRKLWVPMRHQRQDALLLIALNVKHSVIAARLEVTPTTFRRAFRAEIDTAYETQRAEVLIQIAKTARGGNISAQRVLLDTLEKAELDRIDDQIKNSGQHAAQPSKPNLGKKEQAALEAEQVMQDPEWNDLLTPSSDSRPLPN